ncbi:hypothetical protein J8L88_04635 [Aquimarina sp. MMG015]|uniref:hypothetical protein n=1 Tax=Aquimarina sp. MMG015 TaxID=2822689 RepID=UPI001B3A12EC|nr:hypothetical protein [Aquimarina sp. MMG015]MBQ4802132.1 hypothetical protein [Aquimarina sp. MMG015]
MIKGFYQLYIVLGFLCCSHLVIGQETDVQQEEPETPIFNQEESDYIKKWFRTIVDDSNLNEETINRFNVITSYYGLKMKQLGEDHKLTKIEITQGFKNLVNEQNKELKQILPAEQYESFYDFFDKLSWSVNKRLNQL